MSDTESLRRQKISAHFKGKPLSAEHRAKISAARKGQPVNPDAVARMAETKRGSTLTEEHRQNISRSLVGHAVSDATREKLSAASTGRRMPKGELSATWKGDEVGYHALHAWVKREFGPPTTCGRCTNPRSKRFEWANLSGNYTRERSDWESMCASCHRRYDAAKRKAKEQVQACE